MTIYLWKTNHPRLLGQKSLAFIYQPFSAVSYLKFLNKKSRIKKENFDLKHDLNLKPDSSNNALTDWTDASEHENQRIIEVMQGTTLFTHHVHRVYYCKKKLKRLVTQCFLMCIKGGWAIRWWKHILALQKVNFYIGSKADILRLKTKNGLQKWSPDNMSFSERKKFIRNSIWILKFPTKNCDVDSAD